MLKKIDMMLQKMTWRLWIMAFLASQGIYAIMLSLTLPQIQSEAGGMKAFDMQPFGYTSDYVHQFVHQLSGKGYNLYRFVQLPLDTLYPFLSFMTAIATYTLLSRFLRKTLGRMPRTEPSVLDRLVLLVAVAGMLFDYLENMMILIYLHTAVPIPDGFITAGSAFSISKSASVVAFYGICIALAAVIGLTRLYLKIRGIRYDG